MSCFFVFFFFKQKTAYDMRISDWSSDVCSSDLLDRGVEREQVRLLRDRGDDLDHVPDLLRARAEPSHLLVRGLRDVGRLPRDLGRQIGRASCRERVCQYV